MKGEAAELARELGARIAWLAPELLPNVERRGNLLQIGGLTGEKGGSLIINLRGPRQGQWYEFAERRGGDALDLVAKLCCNGSITEAMDWARQWLHKPERERQRPRPLPSASDGKAEAEALLQQNRKRAMTVWRGAKPLQQDDMVWRYLGDRGINLGRLPRVPSVLRFHPQLWNGEAQRHLPAMVAIVGDAEGNNVAVHRTWLAERNLAFEDAPKVGKADLRGPKLTLGSFRGGWIRLWRGAQGKPWTQLTPGETLLISEGIEDLLSYVQFEPQWRAACAVSLSFMLAMQLPPEFTEIRILTQRDKRMADDGVTWALSPARRLLARVIERWELEGRKVFYWGPPVYVKDCNEYIQHRLVTSFGGQDNVGGYG